MHEEGGGGGKECTSPCASRISWGMEAGEGSHAHSKGALDSPPNLSHNLLGKIPRGHPRVNSSSPFFPSSFAADAGGGRSRAMCDGDRGGLGATTLCGRGRYNPPGGIEIEGWEGVRSREATAEESGESGGRGRLGGGGNVIEICTPRMEVGSISLGWSIFHASLLGTHTEGLVRLRIRGCLFSNAISIRDK